MSIPTHNLYDFVHQVTEKKFWLQYFYPWGSRDLNNLINYFDQDSNIDIPVEYIVCKKILPKEKYDYVHIMQLQTILLCHDQEPLNFEMYQYSVEDYSRHTAKPDYYTQDLNLRTKTLSNVQKYFILLHSELNSKETTKYDNSGRFICAYWWSHAVIALDWYRYAEHDKSLNYNIHNNKLFLIYSRDNAGSRQYRQYFIDNINEQNLRHCCQIGSFDKLPVTGDASATYNASDFNNTNISVVLETVVDRIHLTEKILRCIAIGHPFLLLAGSGSLELLKSYGFKTFEPWINESYDKEVDLIKRSDMIINEMKRIMNLKDSLRKEIFSECHKIAQYNKQRFFSKEFFQQITQELKNNVDFAFKKTNNTIDWKHWQKRIVYHKKNYLERYIDPNVNPHRFYFISLIKHLKKGGTLEDYVPPDLD